jgi:hypothetical protein
MRSRQDGQVMKKTLPYLLAGAPMRVEQITSALTHFWLRLLSLIRYCVY